MSRFHRVYTTLRHVVSPCTAYRIAHAARQFKAHMHSTAIWTAAIVLTLGVGALAGHESTAAAQDTAATTTTGQP